MHIERFDDIARALARGASRRQIFKQLLVGAAGATFGYWGAAGRARGEGTATATAAQKILLPYIAKSCSVASVCGGRQYCSTDETCLCLRSAEGDIQCGQIPRCSAQRCKTSADCANLGPGYFCDAPGSGCCDDEQRCIAPCGIPCPAERACGSNCCEPGETCVNGQCRTTVVSSTWTGATTYDGTSVGVRFLLQIYGGTIEGRMEVADPRTGQWLDGGTIWGSQSGNSATWTTEASQEVNGTFNGDSFSGTMTFQPTDYDNSSDPSFSAQLQLTKTGSGIAASAIRTY